MFETDEDKHRTFIQLLRVLDETRGIKLSLEDGKTMHPENELLVLC